MHILPQLRKLEEAHGDWLVVIGVHSAKFTNERATDNLRSAVLRNDIRHPVINDHEFEVWSKYGVRAWPTLMFVDPSGRVIGKHEGEFEFGQLDALLRDMANEFDEMCLLKKAPLQFQLEARAAAERPLSFPGKVEADSANGRLFVADTNHHRVLAIDSEGRVLETVGSGEPGYQDGGFPVAQFTQPQGMAVVGSKVYVADAGNHTIREVDFDARTVSTVAGTGEQALYRHSGGDPLQHPLNSPYDLACHDGVLYIAGAGFHQLWALHLEEGRIEPYAGDGLENIEDGPRLSAHLAQPYGIATGRDRLYFADSESSSVRSVGFGPDARVETLVGIGLFDYGDQNGPFDRAVLQHAEGVAVDEIAVYAADTYNHKIKRLDLQERTVSTVAGSGDRGHEDGPALGASFDEPAGLALMDNRIYVADTNNHAIRVIDLEARTVETMELRFG